MTTHNEKSPVGATNTNEGNKSIRERSTSTAYLAYHPDNTRYTFGTWSGDDLAMKDHITIIVPMKTAQRMYADGPQLIGLNRECADAQSAEVRKQREEKAAKEREEELRRLRREIEDTAYGDEIDALENKLTEIYARVDAEAKARLDAQGKGGNQ